ncbi:hypothetical protein BHYA_0252g00010 [Botrytis hyacinthi]|uniref:Rhodopsin domain-containing protein n=1 Tax=Botrytis hyacinthi TaxID=278943 RepID=A0A4Z1GCX1_9HELO|nr:hypothetical protein BHYA_0252g00010 [Botrytis hyacinthi]
MTYSNPAAIIAISILFPILGLAAVSLRFYTRVNARIRLGIDDWLTVPALAIECILAGLLIWGAATKALGDHLPAPDVPGPDGYLFSDSDRQIQYFFDWIGAFEFGLLKLSILFFYRRIFYTGTRTVFDIINMAFIVFVIVWMLAMGIGAIFLCKTDPRSAWGPVVVIASKCSAQLPFLEGYAISDFIMDVFIWTLPIPKIWGLHMTVRRKLAVIAVFLVGFLTLAASAARMAIYIVYIVNAFSQSDGETLVTYLLFWTMIECGLGVIVVCLPTLRSLYGKVSPGSILSGIKSALAMRSLESHAISEPGIQRLDSLDQSGKSSSSRSNLRGKNEGTLETYIVAAHDLEQQGTLSRHEIRVRDEVEQY